MRTTIVVGVLVGVIAGAAPGDARLMRGALQVVDASRDTFRVIGEPGTYQAPPGVALTPLEGQLVDVHVTDDGRVQRIAPFAVGYAPITVVLRGELRVVDAAKQAFTFHGDTQVYRAPPSIDLGRYDGQSVEARINEGQVTDIARISPPGAGGPVASDAASCRLGDATFASGSQMCTQGTTRRCDNGTWTDLDTPCR